MSITLQEIAERINVELLGNPDCKITGVATLQNAQAGHLSFLSNRRYYRYLKTTSASAVIIAPQDKDNCPVNVLVSSTPYLSYVKAVRLLHPQQLFEQGIDVHASVHDDADISSTAYIGANAVIGAGAQLDDGVYVGPGCVVAENVIIGKNTRLLANVTLCRQVRVGQRVIIHPGAVIGADGFGIANDDGQWLKIPQLGSVIIEDDVEIGANTTIDRGALEDTVIEQGVKIDNQVQIGHNTRVGAHTALAGSVAIAGSVTIGKRCHIGGASCISGHIDIADDVIITGMSGVTNSIKKAGSYSSGLPVMGNKVWRKNIIRFKQLDELARRLITLELFVKKTD